MSTIIMSACWPLQMPSSQKSVLISLADNANDEGVCWPSIERIRERTCLTDRTVQKCLKWLEERGAISRQKRYHRSTIYTVTPGAYQSWRDEEDRLEKALGEESSGENNAATPEKECDSNRKKVLFKPEIASPRTVRESKEEPSRNRQRGAGAPSTRSKPDMSKIPKLSGTLTADDLQGEGVKRQVALDWLSVRRAKDAPLTMTAWELVKSEAAKAEIAVGEAVRVAAENSWAGFRAGWYANQKAAEVSTTMPAQDDLAWLKSWPSIVAKGNELGLHQGDSEAPPHFKVRVLKAASLTDEQKARARVDHGVVL